jgi:hypothetical protein
MKVRRQQVLCLDIARYGSRRNYSIHINSLILDADGLGSIADALVSFIVGFLTRVTKTKK